MAYSSTAEVKAFTAHLLDGQTNFNSTTRPTATEVNKFIARASGVLDTMLAGCGLTVPITNTTAKLVCDDWVTARATEYVELTQRGVGYSGDEGSRTTSFRNMQRAAKEFCAEYSLGFKTLGVPVAFGKARGLSFTGMDAQSERADPDDGTLEQPMFVRHQFDEPTTRSDDEDGGDE